MMKKTFALFVLVLLALHEVHALEALVEGEKKAGLSELKRHHHKRKSLKSRAHQEADDNRDATEMCKAVLKALWPQNGIGAQLTTMTDEQLRACWCIWAKVRKASVLTAGVFEFYTLTPFTSFKSLAKYLLKAAYKAYKDSGSVGTNLISRSFMAWYQRSNAEMCFNGGGMGDDTGVLTGTGCGSITDNCKVIECFRAPDSSLHMRSPFGDCERKKTLSSCSNEGCQPVAKNKCPIDQGAKCRCDKGTVVNSCVCMVPMPSDMPERSYCDKTSALATFF